MLSLVGDILTVKGVFKSLYDSPERNDVEQYIYLLETRRVLFAQFDQELRDPVIQSIKEIKIETEKLRSMLPSKETRKTMAKLISVMQQELANLWAYETTHREGQKKMFMAIQRFRTEMAKTLAILCYAYGIEPNSTELQQLIVNIATVRPNNVVPK